MWIIVGWYNEDWWSKPDVECKGEELLEAAANMIETLPLPLSTSQQPTISDRVSYLSFTSEQHLRAFYNSGRKRSTQKNKNNEYLLTQRQRKVKCRHDIIIF